MIELHGTTFLRRQGARQGTRHGTRQGALLTLTALRTRILLARHRRHSRRNARAQSTGRGSGDGILERTHPALFLLMHSVLLLLTNGFEVLLRRGLAAWRRGWTDGSTAGAEHHLCCLLAGLRCEGAVGGSSAVLDIALPAQGSLWLGHRLDGCAHGCGHSDTIRIVVGTALNAIAGRQEGVEPLDEVWIPRKQRTDSTNDARGIDGTALEVLHDVEEAIVDVGVIGELDFDLVEVAQRVVQDGLLALPLALLLLLVLAHLLWWRLLLLLGGLGLLAGREGHQHAVLHLLASRWALGLRGGLHWSASEDVTRPAWCAERHLRLWLARIC